MANRALTTITARAERAVPPEPATTVAEGVLPNSLLKKVRHGLPSLVFTDKMPVPRKQEGVHNDHC